MNTIKHLFDTCSRMEFKAILLGLSLMNLGCVTGDDFSSPDTSIAEPILDGPEISISAVAGQLAQAQENTELDYSDEETIFTFDLNAIPQYLTGYVISSDEGGNFFEELIIQDQTENPNIGIKILIDVNPLSVRYDPGRQVYLRVNGLSAGITNGVLTIGLRNGNRVDNIPASLENELLQRSTEAYSITALAMDIQDFRDDKTNLYIKLEDVQFNRNLVLGPQRLTYASEQFDEFDGNRRLESCLSNSSTTFSTSTFADFKYLNLPQGRGPVEAILTKDFFGSQFNLRVNSPETVELVNEERCDPNFLECPNQEQGNTLLFSENFENFDGFSDENWTNINISDGNRLWTVGNFSGNNFAQISGFNAGEQRIDVWLISPPINLDLSNSEFVSFDIQASFDNGQALSVFISSDFEGDPESANWIPLDVTVPSGPIGGFGSFEPIPPINISCLEGELHLGFFYQGSDPNLTTRYHIDNVEVYGE